jgi:hypothetical protein
MSFFFLQLEQITEPKIEICDESKHKINENLDSNEATLDSFNNADMDVVIYNIDGTISNEE